MCLALGLIVNPMSILASGSYSYDVGVGNSYISGYTTANPDSCSVYIRGTCLMSDHQTLSNPTANGTKDPNTGQATAYKGLPTNGYKYTRVDGTHKVGSNTYYTTKYN